MRCMCCHHLDELIALSCVLDEMLCCPVFKMRCMYCQHLDEMYVLSLLT